MAEGGEGNVVSFPAEGFYTAYTVDLERNGKRKTVPIRQAETLIIGGDVVEGGKEYRIHGVRVSKGEVRIACYGEDSKPNIMFLIDESVDLNKQGWIITLTPV